MRSAESFGSWSLSAAAVTVMSVQVFHPTMLLPLRAGETAAWLVTLLAGLVAAAAYWPAARALARLPRGDVISLARAGAGPLGAVAVGLLLTGVLTFHGGMVMRETSEMAVSSVYPHTPQTFATVALLLPSLYCALGGVAALIRLCRAFLPLLLLGTLLALAGSVGWGEVRYLLPFWGPGAARLAAGSVLVAALFKGGAVFMLAAAGQLRDRQHLARAGVVAIGAAALVMALTKAVFHMVFPMPLGESVTFPMHEASRLVSGGRFFERVEGMWLFVWVVGTGLHLAAILHAAAAIYARTFGLGTYRAAVLPLVTMAVTISMYPPDTRQALEWHVNGSLPAVAAAFGLPLFLAGLAAWRRRGRGRGA